VSGFYTSEIEDGNLSLKDYLKGCSKAFISTFGEKYDDDGIISDSKYSSVKHYEKVLLEYKSELTLLKGLDEKGIINQYEKCKIKRFEEYNRLIKNDRLKLERLTVMLQKITSWIPPENTDEVDFEQFKSFAETNIESEIKNVNKQIKWWSDEISKKCPDVNVWYKDAIANTERMIGITSEDLRREKLRYNNNTRYIQAMNKALNQLE